MQELALDIGYSSTKAKYQGKLFKFPSAISYASDLGIDYGSDEILEYKGEQYYVGDAAVGSETFTTTDWGFKKTFDPLIIYHVLQKLNLVEAAINNNVKFYLTLALADWKYKDEYLNILSEFTVNNQTLHINEPILMPQGAGAYLSYVKKVGEHPSSAVVVDIGFNTVNFLVYENGQPRKAHSKGFSGHGVSSILRPFTAFLESTYNMPFSEGEALKIFTAGKFVFNGAEQQIIADKIFELKNQFVNRLFKSVLTGEKKIFATSEKVILAGGGCYLLEGVKFAQNTIMVDKPYEFANISSVI